MKLVQALRKKSISPHILALNPYLFGSLIFFSVFVFLVTIRPFGLRYFSLHSIILLSAIYSTCSVFSYFALFFAARFNKLKKWSPIEVMSSLTGHILLNWILIHFSSKYYFGFISSPQLKETMHSMLDNSFQNVLVSSSLIFAFLIVLDRYLFYRRFTLSLKDVPPSKNNLSSSHAEISKKSLQKIEIIGRNNNEQLFSTPENIILVEGQGHYAKILFLDNLVIKKVVFRNSLSEINKQLIAQKLSMLQLNRSILVNPSFIIELNDDQHSIQIDKVFKTINLSRSSYHKVKMKFTRIQQSTTNTNISMFYEKPHA